MEQTTLPLSYIRILYNEAPELVRYQKEAQLSAHPEQEQQYQEFRQLKRCLDQQAVKPSREVLHSVLDYARDKN
jgi:hypothetical protein